LSRLIKTGSASKDRILLEKGVVLAIRELTIQSGIDANTKDLLAYIALSLKAIGETIEESVTAWEKRGYWVKADRYRMEWIWANNLGEEMKQAILSDDWGSVVRITAQVTQEMSKVKISQRKRLGSPWEGSFEKLKGPNHSH
jgi:hypothetical protein